ncbi:hypothetical protein HPP92_006631 [Vanilla planifolia]|uniref:FAS1 domain-containing protein n=1 Tax=Vanilla planifolia TaxID=51239 RepID=A0A835R901_VANPL|nr:hypothetical protein HPP92_006631 [Vanilla planifolia]
MICSSASCCHPISFHLSPQLSPSVSSHSPSLSRDRNETPFIALRERSIEKAPLSHITLPFRLFNLPCIESLDHRDQSYCSVPRSSRRPPLSLLSPSFPPSLFLSPLVRRLPLHAGLGATCQLGLQAMCTNASCIQEITRRLDYIGFPFASSLTKQQKSVCFSFSELSIVALNMSSSYGFYAGGFPDVARGARPGLSTSAHGHVESGLGELGLLMISMLPDDLSFTVFSPSEKAFEHVLKLANSSLVVDKRNDTLAILSRIMAFCSVPWAVPSEAVPMQKELTLDSVSGLKIFVRKELNGSLIANNIRSEQVDLIKGKIIVHVMMGVIMDVEFELSFVPDSEFSSDKYKV